MCLGFWLMKDRGVVSSPPPLPSELIDLVDANTRPLDARDVSDLAAACAVDAGELMMTTSADDE